MNNFAFEPSDGLKNTTIFPTNPGSESQARAQIQAPLDQMRDFINNTIVEFFNSGGTINGEVVVNGLRSSKKITYGQSYNDVTGCTSLPNDYINQWGSATIPSGVATVVNFKQPFVSNCYSVVATVKGAEPYPISVSDITKTSFSLTQNSGKNLDINYIAIGY